MRYPSFLSFITLASTLGLYSCSNKSGNTASAPAAQRIEIKETTAEQAEQRFGLSFSNQSDDLRLNGYYHAYTDASGKETLHGKFEISCNKSMEEFTKNGNTEYSCLSYKGQYADGVKDGLFEKKHIGVGFGMEYSILFDAKTGGCTEATLKGDAEGSCYEFKGKVPSCKFEDIPENEKDC